LISGCAAPPQNDVDIQFYDALAYETMWYANEHDLQKRHPNVHHAFGIDTRVMHSLPEVEKVWDLLFVGWIADYKRLDLFIARFKRMKHEARSKSLPMPRALVIGNNSMEESKALTARILRAGIHMLEEVPYADLVEIINASREMYIPARIDGGGERAVLEARSCGVEISVEQDNPKLLELATPTNPFFDEVYYARQLHQIVLSLNLPGRGKDYQDV
jgi:glycosyltransferase involved in cell wall biosynthesis